MKGAEDKLVQVGKKARNEVCVCVWMLWCVTVVVVGGGGGLGGTLKVFVCMCAYVGVWGCGDVEMWAMCCEQYCSNVQTVCVWNVRWVSKLYTMFGWVCI